MIQKVNRPTFLRLVSSSKAPENDPGSSQGSGVAYEKVSDSFSGSDAKKDEKEEKKESDTSAPLAVVGTEKMGMTEVVKDLYEKKQKEEAHSSNPGLTTRYHADTNPAKGLLLNRKVE